MAILAIKGNPSRGKDIAKLFTDLGAKEFAVELTEEKFLYYIAHDKKVISIPDQPKNIYRNLLFNVYTIEEFEAKFPFRVGDKVTYEVYYSLEEPCKEVTSCINRMSWDTERSEVFYTIVTGTMRIACQLRWASFEPKDGDVVSIDDGSQIFVCKNYLGHEFLYAYFGLDFESNRFYEEGSWSASRFATKEEKKQFFDKLKEKGYEWDSEKRELVKLKWKPEYKENYWSPALYNNGFVKWMYSWQNSEFDNKRLEKDWVFRTEEECQAFCDKLNEAINQVKP